MFNHQGHQGHQVRQKNIFGLNLKLLNIQGETLFNHQGHHKRPQRILVKENHLNHQGNAGQQERQSMILNYELSNLVPLVPLVVKD